MSTKVPTFDQLMWPTLKALKNMGGSGTNSEILEKVIDRMAEIVDQLEAALEELRGIEEELGVV